MGKEISTNEARKLLSAHQNALGKRRRRQHDYTAEYKSFQLTVLSSDLCPQCQSLRIYDDGPAPNGFHIIGLNCKSGLNPVEIFREKPFLAEPECDKFTAK